MIQSDESMDSQPTSGSPVDLAAIQNAAPVKPAIPQAAPAVANNGPLNGPPRLQQQQPPPGQFGVAGPGPRVPYGPGALQGQRAPIPRGAFFPRPPQPGQAPGRFPPPRGPPPPGQPGAYGPQAFPLTRPAFPPPGVEPRFLRPQQPVLLRRQSSLTAAKMAEASPLDMPAQVSLQPKDKPQSQAEQHSDKDNAASDEKQSPNRVVAPTAADETPSSPTNARDQSAPKQQHPDTPSTPVKLPSSLVNESAPTALLAETPKQDSPRRAQSAVPGLLAETPKPDSPSRAQSALPALLAEQAKPDVRAQSAAPTVSQARPASSQVAGGKGSNEQQVSSPTASPLHSDSQQTAETCNPSPKRTTPVAAAATPTDQAQKPARARPDAIQTRPINKSASARSIKQDAENDSGVDESTQRREAPKSNGVSSRTPSKTRGSLAGSPIKSPNKSVKSLPRTPDAAPPTADKKKLPMNKVQVGAAPSPNLKAVRSKIGSLENTTHKPGGGKIKIENRKLDFSSAQPKIAAKNDKYTPSGGDKKIEQVKLQWNAKPKIGSLDNATYKPGGGNKKIESVKLDFKDKAKSKVGSKENAKHVPGGGAIKSSATSAKSTLENISSIESQKLDFKAESKVGSMDNMKHRPGGGDKKIFDDKSYLRQTSSNVGSVSGSGSQVAPKRPDSLVGLSPSDKKSLFDAPQPPPSTPTLSRNPTSPSSVVITPGSDKTPVTPTVSKKSLPSSPRKNEPTKELQLPKVSPSNSKRLVATETRKTNQTKIILPNL